MFTTREYVHAHSAFIFFYRVKASPHALSRVIAVARVLGRRKFACSSRIPNPLQPSLYMSRIRNPLSFPLYSSDSPVLCSSYKRHSSYLYISTGDASWKCSAHDITKNAWTTKARLRKTQFIFRDFSLSTVHSSYGMSFVLPRYFKAVTGDSDDGMYILSIVLEMLYAPGTWRCACPGYKQNGPFCVFYHCDRGCRTSTLSRYIYIYIYNESRVEARTIA